MSITSLPLEGKELQEFVDAANKLFSKMLKDMRPDNIEIVNALWDAEHFVLHDLFHEDMLPMSKAWARARIHPTLVRHLVRLVLEATDIRTASRTLN